MQTVKSSAGTEAARESPISVSYQARAKIQRNGLHRICGRLHNTVCGISICRRAKPTAAGISFSRLVRAAALLLFGRY